MALTYIGSVSGGAANGGTVTLDLTSLSLQENDIIVALYGFNSGGTDYDMSISGYTELADLFSNSGGRVNFYVGYKIMGATPDSSVVMNGNGETSASTTGLVYVWRGENTITPIDVTTTTAIGGNTEPDSPSITPITSGAIVLSLIYADQSRTFTAPTGYTNLEQVSASDTRSNTIAASSKAWSGSGAEDPGNWTGSFPVAWGAASVVIRPAVTPGSSKFFQLF